MSARRMLLACLVVAVLSSLSSSARSAPGDAFPVSIKVDAGTSRGDLHPIWRFFGADEPNYAYMKDGRKLLAELGRLGPPQVYFRTHNLLTTGDGTPALKWGCTNAYTEDAQGKPGLRLDDRGPHLRHLPASAASSPTCRSASCPRRSRSSPSRTSTSGAPGCRTTTSTPAGPIRRRTTRKWARARLPVGQALRGEVRPGRGRALVLGGLERAQHRLLAGHARGVPQAPRLRDRRACAAPCPRPGSAGRTPRAAGGPFLRDFLEHCLRGTNYATGKIGHAARLHLLPRQGGAEVRGRPRPDGHRQPAPGRSTGLRRSSRPSPS